MRKSWIAGCWQGRGKLQRGTFHPRNTPAFRHERAIYQNNMHTETSSTSDSFSHQGVHILPLLAGIYTACPCREREENHDGTRRDDMPSRSHPPPRRSQGDHSHGSGMRDYDKTEGCCLLERSKGAGISRSDSRRQFVDPIAGGAG